MTTNSPSLNENPANWRPRKSDQILDLEAAADLETRNLFINRRIRGSTAARGLPQPKNQTNQTYSYSLHRIMSLSSYPKLLEPIPKLNLYELIFSCVTVYITSTALKSIWQNHKQIFILNYFRETTVIFRSQLHIQTGLNQKLRRLFWQWNLNLFIKMKQFPFCCAPVDTGHLFPYKPDPMPRFFRHTLLKNPKFEPFYKASEAENLRCQLNE